MSTRTSPDCGSVSSRETLLPLSCFFASSAFMLSLAHGPSPRGAGRGGRLFLHGLCEVGPDAIVDRGLAPDRERGLVVGSEAAKLALGQAEGLAWNRTELRGHLRGPLHQLVRLDDLVDHA